MTGSKVRTANASKSSEDSSRSVPVNSPVTVNSIQPVALILGLMICVGMPRTMRRASVLVLPVRFVNVPPTLSSCSWMADFNTTPPISFNFPTSALTSLTWLLVMDRPRGVGVVHPKWKSAAAAKA